MIKKTPITRGFTIVELLIVIVVIGILATITILAFNGTQDRAKFTNIQSNLKGVDAAIRVHNVENGTYPITGTRAAPGWRYSCATGIGSFIPGLTSTVRNITQAPCLAANANDDTWLYASDGVGYKLLHIRPGFTSSIQNGIEPGLRDFRWGSTGGTWGYWTADWAAI